MGNKNTSSTTNEGLKEIDKQTNPVMYGWRCPICGRVYSPYVSMCAYRGKDKDKKPKIDVFKIIENRFKNMNELRDLIDMDPKKGLVRIRDGAGFREVERGGCLHRNYLNLLEEELGAKLSIDLIDKYIKRK